MFVNRENFFFISALFEYYTWLSTRKEIPIANDLNEKLKLPEISHRTQAQENDIKMLNYRFIKWNERKIRQAQIKKIISGLAGKSCPT